MADNTITLVGNLTRDPEFVSPPVDAASPASGLRSVADTRSTTNGKNKHRSSMSLLGASSARTLPRRSPRVHAASCPVGLNSVSTKRKAARRRALSKLLPTKSGPACDGLLPRLNAPHDPAPKVAVRAVVGGSQGGGNRAPDPVYGDEEPF